MACSLGYSIGLFPITLKKSVISFIFLYLPFMANFYQEPLIQDPDP